MHRRMVEMRDSETPSKSPQTCVTSAAASASLGASAAMRASAVSPLRSRVAALLAPRTPG